MRSRLNSSERDGPWRCASLEIAVSVNVMTYKADVPRMLTGQNPPPGPIASEAALKPAYPDALPFQRPGADILNEAIPAFFIGRNHDGFWVARDANGKSGGLFWSCRAALRFARAVWPEGCATIFPQGRFELDIENTGNPLICWLEAAKGWLARRRGRSWPRLPQ
jgi:hypothetical protein